MRIEGTALYADIAMIMADKSQPTHFRFDIFVRGGGQQAIAMKMVALDETRNFQGDYGDKIVMEALFVESDYNRVILPNIKDLEVIITKSRVGRPSGPNADKTFTSATYRYKATVGDVTVPEVGESNLNSHDPTNAMKSVTFQLIDRALYQLRLTTVGGIFRSTTAVDVLNVMLTGKSKALEVDDAVKPLGVELVPADTALKEDGKPNLRDHVVIKSGTPLFDLAGYLQKHCGGIYNNGIGCYYTNRLWYVYPLFDNSRFDRTPRTLTIIRVPADAMPDIDHSYTMLGDHLFVLATDEAISVDQTDHKQLNSGNAKIFPTATGIMDKYVPVDDSAGFSSESDTLGRISVRARPDGLNSAQFDVSHVTDNTAMMISELAQNTQQFMQFGWGYSNPALLYPGMPTRVLYNKAGIVETLQGTLVGGDSFTELATPGMATVHYQTKTALSVLLDKPPEKRA